MRRTTLGGDPSAGLAFLTKTTDLRLKPAKIKTSVDSKYDCFELLSWSFGGGGPVPWFEALLSPQVTLLHK